MVDIRIIILKLNRIRAAPTQRGPLAWVTPVEYYMKYNARDDPQIVYIIAQDKG